jgi:hypothetical protein
MVDFARPKFSLGRTVATPAALRVIERAGQSPAEFLDRHICGDWGNLSADDRALNDEAIQDGSRIFSAYRTRTGTKIWVITEAADDHGQRAATTILLADEY